MFLKHSLVVIDKKIEIEREVLYQEYTVENIWLSLYRPVAQKVERANWKKLLFANLFSARRKNAEWLVMCVQQHLLADLNVGSSKLKILVFKVGSIPYQEVYIRGP